MAACTLEFAWSYAAQGWWKSEAISLGTAESGASIAESAVAKTCWKALTFAVAPGLVL